MKKIIRRFLCTTIAVLSLIVIAFPSTVVIAEDIDLFTGTSATPQKPNVLIILDNSANWNSNSQHWPGGIKQGEAELKAMAAVISGLTDGVNVGLMMLTQGLGNHTSPSYQNTNGGYMRYAIRTMTAANKAAFLQLMGVNADGTTHAACVGLGPSDTPPTVYIPVATAAPWTQAQTPSGSGVALTRGCIVQFFSSNTEQVPTSGGDWSGALFDAFKYFGGGTNQAIQNRLGLGPDRYGGNPDAKCDPFAYVNGATDANKTTYLPPISNANNCAKNYIIFIGNGFSAAEPGEPANLTAVGGDTTVLKMPQFSTSFVPSTTPLGTDAVCETNAQCVTRATTLGAGGYDSYTCTGGTQSSVQTGVSGVCETLTNCQTVTAPATFPGAYTYTCSAGTSGGGTVTNLPSTVANPNPYPVCATNAACVTHATAVGAPLVAPFTCTGGSTTTTITTDNTCIAMNGGNCAANAPGLLPGYGSYSCSGGDGTGCAGSTRKNWTVTGTCAGGGSINQTMRGTSASTCAAGTEINRPITATPTAGVCNGSNFRNQTMNGVKSPGVAVVTPLGTEALPSPSNKNRYADEWTKFLFGTDVNGADSKQNIKTYTIDVFKDAQDADATALLFNMAKVGGGKYFTAGSEAEIKDALTKILIEIQAENSVFAAAALPVGATNRAQNENQVFFGSFRPDADGAPRWVGNLKRYQIVLDIARNPILAGQDKVNAVSSSGFFGPCAVSFWTSDSGSYWSFSTAAAGQCTAVAGSTYSDLPDGGQVEKGGAAEVLRKGNNPPTTDTTPTYAVNRTMYTCASTAACPAPAPATNGLVAFDTTNVSIAALTAADATEQARIVNYTRGQDVGQAGAQAGDENLNGSTTDTRASIHGDVAHSRPMPVNYGGVGAYQSTGVVAYYGANDGALRAVQTSNGKELWSFIAPEHHGKLKRLKNNSEVILYPNQPVTVPPASPKDYFFDGSMGLYQTVDNSKIWMYASMRRGGRMIYAFDVTNPTAPVLKWRFGCPNLNDDVGCTTGASGIGQTWSAPNVAFIKGYSTTDPVVVIGGGNDACWDADNIAPSCGSNKGNKVYVINGNTGALVKTFDTDASVTADIALVERNADGSVDHGYVADLGGNLYRVDFVAPATPATFLPATSWTISKIATVTAGSGRRFILAPAVAPRSDRVFVTIGSGNRERPLISNYPYTYNDPIGVINRFYALMDTFPTPVAPATTVPPIDLDGSTVTDITSAALTTCLSPTGTIQGWRTNLAGGRGEQVVSSSLISEGKVFFNTNRPVPVSSGVCDANLGEARGYNIDLFCGTQFNVVYAGGGLPISPVQATTVACQADGSNCGATTFCIGCATDPSQTSQFSPGKIKPVIAARRTRLFWHASLNR